MTQRRLVQWPYVRVVAEVHQGLLIGQVDSGEQLWGCQPLGVAALPS